MANIGFFVFPNESCLNASLKLAADLRARRHRVYYVGLQDSAEYIAANGFDFVPVFTRHFPKGFHQAVARMETPKPWRETYVLGRKFIRNYKEFVDSLIAGEDTTFQDALREYRLEMMIYVSDDYFVDWPALLAYKVGIPGVYFPQILNPRANSASPPCDSNLIPSDSYWSHTRVFLEWKRRILSYPVSVVLRMLDLNLDIGAWTRKLADACGYRRELVCDPLRKPTLMKLPELIPFPPGFEFFDENVPGQHFIGCCVYEERQQAPFSWEKLDSRPLIYCALGTVPFFNKDGYMKFFETVVRASTVRPECQWVLALGSTLGVDELGELPENVIAVQRAPQLDLLRRAKLMITHGGASSVKECLYYGVPMIVIPFAEDMYGNAARVVYHGLGVRAELRKLTVKHLQDLVEAVDRSSYIRWQSIAWSRKSKEIEQSNLAVFLIEKFLSEGQ